MKLVKMRILTFKIRRMRMRLEVIYFISRNVVHWFRSIKWL